MLIMALGIFHGPANRVLLKGQMLITLLSTEKDYLIKKFDFDRVVTLYNQLGETYYVHIKKQSIGVSKD